MPKRLEDLAQKKFPFEAGSDAGIDGQVRAALTRVRRGSRRSIQQIADGMTRRLGVRVSHHQLNSYCSERHARRFPLAWAPAWCAETGDLSLLRLAAEALGLRLADSDLVGFAEQRLRAELAGAEADVHRSRVLRKGLV